MADTSAPQNRGFHPHFAIRYLYAAIRPLDCECLNYSVKSHFLILEAYFFLRSPPNPFIAAFFVRLRTLSASLRRRTHTVKHLRP